MEERHSHHWKVTVAFRAGKLNPNGFVIDFVPVMAALKEVCRQLEGKDLNQALAHPDTGASAERVAKFLADQMYERMGRSVYCVRVTEAPGCMAAYFTSEGSLDVTADISLR